MEQLSRWLSAGSLLIHHEKGGPATNLRTVLLARLAQYRAQRGLPERDDSDILLEHAQEETAQEALSVVEGVQRILDQDAPGISPVSGGDTHEVPVIGTRDISQLRTLLSIVFKWGTEPLLTRLQVVWPTKGHTQTQLVDADDAPHSYERLTTMTRRLLSLLFPRGVHGTLPQTLITSILLHRHVTDILRPAIVLGWVPKALYPESFPVVDDFRPLVMRLMSMYELRSTARKTVELIMVSAAYHHRRPSRLLAPSCPSHPLHRLRSTSTDPAHLCSVDN
jgi:hypothetical protein